MRKSLIIQKKGWWRRWELNPRPKRLGVMRYVRLPGTPRRVSRCLSIAVIQVINTTMRSPDLPLIAGGPKNIRNQAQVSFSVEHWGARGPQTSLSYSCSREVVVVVGN